MKERSVEKVKIVSANTEAEFEDKYNSTIQELSNYTPERLSFSLDSLRAAIVYVEETRVPESVKEEYELDGINFTCAQCPYLERGSDKRRKRWPCKYATYRMSSTDMIACDKFYREYDAGKITPVEG